MNREELISSKEYWSTKIALSLWTYNGSRDDDFDTYEKMAESIVDDDFIKAMEEYRSQLTESKELPNDDAVHDNAERRADLNFDEEIGYILGAKWMRSIASPLLASKDARIRELEEELEREKNSVRIITKDVVDQILNPSLEIGKTYKTKGGSKGTVIAWIAQIKMYQVKYWNDEIHEVNSKGEAVLLDNINATPYDLILTPPKN